MNKFTAIEYNPDIEHLNTYAATIIENTIAELSEKQDKVVIGLCGGRSVGSIFELLSRNKNIKWKNVHFFMIDERLVPISSEDSNYKLAAEVLLDPLKEAGAITDANCHPFILDDTQSDFGVQKYSDELASNGGKFDIAILSGGEDGHIGAIYPNHHSFDNEAEYYMYMSDSPKPPSDRMSASRKLMMRTNTALLLVIGESKKEMFHKLLDEKVEPRGCPARLVTQLPVSYLVTTHQA